MTTRIMVIDDEPLICTLLEYQLGGAGYLVTAFQRADEALRHMAQEQPDLILLDVMMPAISGWDLCRQIRASSAVPVIMLTAKQGDEDVVTGLTSGADDYVGKPFNQAQLIARIEAVLRRTQRRAPRAAAITPQPALATLKRTPATPVTLAPMAPTQSPAVLPANRPAAVPQRLGVRLRETRHRQGISLHEAAQKTGVRWEFLQAIEQEEFSFVPRPELRLALKSYSSMLGVDLAPYTGRRRRSKGPRAFSLTVGMVSVLAVALVLVAMAL